MSENYDIENEMRFNYLGKNVDLKGFSESDWIYSRIRETGLFYEIDLLRYIQYSMGGKPQGCILDVGANIGNHSVFFGMYLAERVVTFEPNPKVFPILLENLSDNSIKHKSYRLGLGDREAKATIELPDEHVHNIGAAKLTEIQGAGPASWETITVVTLDSLLPEIETFLNGLNITAIKIDVEGMEPAVLRGGLRLLEKYKPDLFVEISSAEQMEKVLSVLCPIGYRPIVSWAATPVWHFAHNDQLSFVRMLRLYVYVLMHKNIKNFLRGMKRRIKH